MCLERAAERGFNRELLRAIGPDVRTPMARGKVGRTFQPSAAACLDDVLDCPTLLARGDAAARQIMEKYPLFMREFGPTHR